MNRYESYHRKAKIIKNKVKSDTAKDNHLLLDSTERSQKGKILCEGFKNVFIQR